MAKELQEPTDFTVLGVPGPEGLVRPGARDGGLSPPGKRDQAGSSASDRATRPCTNQSRATASAARKTTFVATDGCDHHSVAMSSGDSSLRLVSSRFWALGDASCVSPKVMSDGFAMSATVVFPSSMLETSGFGEEGFDIGLPPPGVAARSSDDGD